MMKRRTFLEAIVASAGALVILPACGSDDEAGATPGPESVEPGEQFFPQSLASGDPKPDSVVLWTRAVDGQADLTLALQLAKDDAFTQRVTLDGQSELSVTAAGASDNCVKVRVAGLEAGSIYYYRFVYRKDGKAYASRTGRTKTAAAADADVAVNFAVVSCQDFAGRYYHVYRHMAEQDLDFVVHLGDYVYETTGDPGFQDVDPARLVKFTDEAGAIKLGAAPDEFFAAQSVDNYRELYKIYRNDPDLQRIHELFPMIIIWDDHEFSDDCWGQNATYFDGAQQELSAQRRSNADQAWFEYMPVDYIAGADFEYDPSGAFPENLKIYRELKFGKHLHLVMTDLRRFRSDHVIPEDAFPGAIAVDQAQLTTALGSVPALAAPYVDIDSYDGGSYATLLKAEAQNLGYSAEKFSGLISVPFINSRVEEINTAGGPNAPATPIDEMDASLMRGIAYHQVLKNSEFSAIGARYLVVKEAFDIIAKVRYAESSGASESGMGAEQEAWFLNAIKTSDRTWKVWGNEYTLMSRVVDLTSAASLPPAFRANFYLSAEDWDGMPNRRQELLTELVEVPNVVAVTGDIHAFFAGTPALASDPAKRVVEFVCGGVSSSTYRTLLVRQASSDPVLAAAGAPALAMAVDTFLTDPVSKPNPHLGMVKTDLNGYGIAKLDGQTFNMTYYAISEADVKKKPADLPNPKFTTYQFKTEAGAADLYRMEGGAWQRWDMSSVKWV